VRVHFRVENQLVVVVQAIKYDPAFKR